MKKRKAALICAGICFVVCIAVLVGLYLIKTRTDRQQTPEEIVTVRLNDMLKNTGDHEDGQEEKLAELFMDRLSNTQLACAIEDPGEHQLDLFRKAADGFAKAEYQVSECYRTDTEAAVEITLPVFKMQEIEGNVQKKLADALEKDSTMSVDQMISKFYEILGEEFQNGPAAETETDVMVFLHSEDGNWVLEDRFEQKIFEAVLKQ